MSAKLLSCILIKCTFQSDPFKMLLCLQVNCFNSLGCTYCHILVDWSSSIFFPEWSLHKVGWCLGYLLIFHSCKLMLLMRTIQLIFWFIYQVSLGLLLSRSSASISLLQWLLGRWCLVWNLFSSQFTRWSNQLIPWHTIFSSCSFTYYKSHWQTNQFVSDGEAL